MRTAVRQLGSWSLIAAYTVLWMGGSAWHEVTCSGRHASQLSDGAACDRDPLHHSCCGHHHAHTHDPGPSHSPGSPAAPDHDENDCQVCHWFGQAQTPAALVMFLVSGAVCEEAQPLPALSATPTLVACYDSRGPPPCCAA